MSLHEVAGSSLGVTGQIPIRTRPRRPRPPGIGSSRRAAIAAWPGTPNTPPFPRPTVGGALGRGENRTRIRRQRSVRLRSSRPCFVTYMIEAPAMLQVGQHAIDQ
jgi:hypothetical protein